MPAHAGIHVLWQVGRRGWPGKPGHDDGWHGDVALPRHRARAVLRRAGLHRVPRLGARALRARRDRRLRLRPAARASSSTVRPRVREQHGGAAGATGRRGSARTTCVDIDALAAISRDRAHPRRRDRGRRQRPADHLRARPQPDLLLLRRRDRLPARRQAPGRRHVRDRLLRLSRLPRRHHQGDAGRARPRHGPPLRHPYAADVDRQGGDVRAGATRSAATRSSTCWSRRRTPAISATARTGTPGVTAAASARPAGCARRVSPNGRPRNELRPIRQAAPRHHRDHHHHAAQEGHPALLDGRADAARAFRPAADRAGLHAALRAGARGSGDAGELGQADLDPRRDRGHAGRLHRGRRRHGGARPPASSATSW